MPGFSNELEAEFLVMLDAADEGDSLNFGRQREEFIDEFAAFFGTDASVLLDKGRMNMPNPLKPGANARAEAEKRFHDVRSLSMSLQIAKPETARTRMLAGDLQKILQPIDELYRQRVAAANEAFSPDPIDPIDRQRQQTQSRASDYPYDRQITYGRPIGTAMGGDHYQRYPDLHPPQAKRKKPRDVIPMTHRGTAWEQLESALDTYEPGPQASDAAFFGYGQTGRLGDGIDVIDLDLDAAKHDFLTSFVDTLPQAQSMDAKSLFTMLGELDPEFSAQLFAPDDDSEMADIYMDWGRTAVRPLYDDEEDADEDLAY